MGLDYTMLLQEAKERRDAAIKMMDALDVQFALDRLDEIYPSAKPILRVRLARIQQSQDYMRAVDDMSAILGDAERDIVVIENEAKEHERREMAYQNREYEASV